MIRVTIGTAMIIGSFIFKATLNHNIEYWGSVKSWTVFFFIIGLVIVGLPIFERIEKSKPRIFRIDPPKWILYAIKAFVVVVIMVAIGIQLEKFGVWSNERICEYYLSKETVSTDGIIVGERRVSYTIKYTTHYERFYVIKYFGNGRFIEQGVKQPSRNFQIGRAYRIIYSKKFPSIFKVMN